VGSGDLWVSQHEADSGVTSDIESRGYGDHPRRLAYLCDL
jgi:hypothetical protein